MNVSQFVFRIFSFLIFFVLVGCGGGGGSAPGDTTAPLVSNIFPVDAATISSSQVITATFDESIETSTFSATGTLGTPSISWSTQVVSNDTVTLTPNTSWNSNVGELTLNGKDAAGNALVPVTVSYTVDPALPGGTTVPPSLSTIKNDQTVVVTFNKEMNPATTALSGLMAGEAGTGTWSSVSLTNDTLTFSPLSGWSAGSDRTLTINVDDMVGNTAQVDLTYTVDTTAPSQSNINPVVSATLSATGQITIVFNESMDPASLVFGGDMGVEAAGTWSQTTLSNDTLTINPSTQWTGGAGRALTVNATDVAGNPLPQINLSYTVDATLPTASEAPVIGQTINGTQAIVLTFSESMQSGSLSLGGTMAVNSDGGVWNPGTDTLTISPSSAWTEGARTLTVDVNDAAGNPLSTISLNYIVDTTPPVITAELAGNSPMAKGDYLYFGFSESVDTATLVLGGSMASTPPWSYWEQVTSPDDRLRLVGGASYIWPIDDQTLSITVSDLVGNEAVLNINYGVLDGIVYVSATGNDANPGTKGSPKATPQAGVDLAVTYGSSSFTVAVHVSTGIYTSTSGPVVDLPEYVSLWGGYSADFSVRDAATNMTILQYLGSSSAGLIEDGSAVIYIRGAHTTSSIVDGFFMKNGYGDTYSNYNSRSGVMIIADGGAGYPNSVKIQNNVIDVFGGSPIGVAAFGYILPSISNNVIKVRGYAISRGLYGNEIYQSVYTPSSMMGASDNTIIVSSDTNNGLGIDVNSGLYADANYINAASTSASYGISITGASSSSDTSLLNNMIISASNQPYGIDVYSGAYFGNHNIHSNTVYTEGSASASSNRGVSVSTADVNNFIVKNNLILGNGLPASSNQNIGMAGFAAQFTNNNISGYSYLGASGLISYSDMLSFEAAITAASNFATSNLNVSPNLVDPANGDLNLQGTSPCSVTQGASNYASVDFYGTPRTSLYSIGAHEYEGTCATP